MKRSALLLAWLLCSLCSTAQHTEYWAGYITSIQVGKKYSIWNDFHYLPTAFWVNRHGLTWHFRKNHTLTGGYAYVLTATGGSTDLVRPEHRPWAQYEVLCPLGRNWGWRIRVRYDHRIRAVMIGQETTNDFTAYNRWRLMLSARRTLIKFDNGNKLHLNVLNEVLLNQGRQRPIPEGRNGLLDQNRAYLMVGFDLPKVRILGGVHDRAIPRDGDEIEHKRGFTVWVIHRLNTESYAAP